MPVAAPELARLYELVSSGGPEALKAAEKAAAKAAKKSAKKMNRRLAISAAVSEESSSSSSSSSSSESDSEDEGEKGENQLLDVATIAVSLSRLGKRQKRRQRGSLMQGAASVDGDTSTAATASSSPSSSSAAFDSDAAALTVMHTLSGSVSFPSPSSSSLSAPSVESGEGEVQAAPSSPPAPAFAVCVGPDCSRRGGQEVAARLALAEQLRRESGAPPRDVVRCGCLGECGGRRGALARGATAGKVEVVAAALERSLAPLL